MKHIYLLFLVISSFAFSQIPSNYYNSANGLSGFTLKTELKNITTNGHFWSTNNPDSYDELYNAYVNTHTDANVSSGNIYENDGFVLDFYSENPENSSSPTPNSPTNDEYNFVHNVDNGGNQTQEGDCYNREHLVPQSSFNSAYPMQSDIHHVIPTDCRVNNFRGSLPFGNVDVNDSGLWISENGSLRGNSDTVGYSGDMFEPIDEFKGDIARALLYFATRYENTVDNYTSFVMFNGTENQVFQGWAIDLLLDWHYNVDPVDQRERDRNNAAYAFQGNANPFVDHPEYANAIWNPTPDTQSPTAPTNLVASNPTNTTIDLTWTASSDNIGVSSYDIYLDGVNSFNTTNTTFTVSALTQNTTYCFTVIAKDAAGNESVASNQDCETTTNVTNPPSNELFFSEYVEGGGTNKALEIANFTGNTINLSTYTLKLASNGNSFGTTYTFPSNASITNGDVYVIANSGLASACQSAQDNVNNSITGFNGNDAIGLFKNNVLIDIIGEEGNNSSFGANVTLIRKPNVSGPSTTFNLSTEWDSFAQDTCSNLGTHAQALSISSNTIKDIKIFPNPVTGNSFKIVYNGSITLEIYDILGKRIQSLKLNSNSKKIDASSLRKGVYILKLQTENGILTKKLIKQ